ncbi:ABC-2 transporter permease [Bifidobacterium sp. ESL0798]|uniref:ABC-2 transporter permease n=1 Tax=Bifidobacterium sp. ESL0798 TaxID=2983235 RepID=UPI0023F8A971|nr:ABC-2 transporter permease [Bifidobacterium sp. ESL0798]WEV73332.1 ABC-2 transporter permease [Bifidobacterium sp. ESL0798]
MDSKQINKAFRIDIYKILAWSSGKGIGSGSVLLLVGLPLLFAIMARIGGNDGITGPMSGGITGLLVAISGMMGIMVFSYEDQTGTAKLNCLLPASRANQVVGRYAFTLLCIVIAALLQVICGLVMYMPHSMGAVAGLTVIVLAVGTIYASLTLPIGYRFPATKAMGYALLLLVALGAIMVLIGFTMPEATLNKVVHFVTTAKLGPFPGYPLSASS